MVFLRRLHAGLIIAIIASVFLISFLIGRANVIEKSKDEDKKIEYNGVVPVPKKEEENIGASNEAHNVPDNTVQDVSIEDVVTMPQKMIFPCGKTVQKEYSQTAVYSETMGDWRAHTGIDYAAQIGEEVKAVWDGKVLKAYKDKLWGYMIKIQHDKGVVSVYKNLGENLHVVEGQAVKTGQVIGFVGDSADIESLENPHLHFEIHYNDVTMNPESYVY